MIPSTQPSIGFESESLQADVMRFMAIIGFCLVAIFAIVPNTDARPTLPEPKTVVSSEATTAPPRPSPVATPEPSVPSDNPPPPVAVASEPGLSLGFTSDADFLRLVGAGTIELFVMDNAATAEPTLRFDIRQPPNGFSPASAPGQFYELLPQTIPETITRALAARLAASESGSASGALTWGVTLPPALERDIAQQREQHSQGTLLIDRYARIRHVPPA